MEFAGIEVAEKPVPGNWKELRAVLVKETSSDDWPKTLKRASLADIETLMNNPLARAVASLKNRFVDHEAFARLVIEKLDDTFMIENDAKENVTVQWWDPLRRVWVRAGGGRRL